MRQLDSPSTVLSRRAAGLPLEYGALADRAAERMKVKIVL